MFGTRSRTYNDEDDDVANNVLDHDGDYDGKETLTIAMAAIFFNFPSFNQTYLTTTFLTSAFGSCFPQPLRQCYNTTCHQLDDRRIKS